MRLEQRRSITAWEMDHAKRDNVQYETTEKHLLKQRPSLGEVIFIMTQWFCVVHFAMCTLWKAPHPYPILLE